MSNFMGIYELTPSARKSLEKAIEETFEADLSKSKLLHPVVTRPRGHHIDTIVIQKEDETILVSEGVSATKVRGVPYTEVFAKIKSNTAEAVNLCDAIIRNACGTNEETPVEYECGLLCGNRCEYVFFDGWEAYYETTGYWGAFIIPKLTKAIDYKKYSFCQLIPAYKEELVFVEENAPEEYPKLCKLIVEQISERQYFDEKHDMLSKEKLEEILLKFRQG